MKNYILLLAVLAMAIVLASCDKEVSVSPPDEPPPDGYLFIESSPPGAQIYVEGRNRRRATPDSITWLETGVYNFSLKKDFFLDTTFALEVVEGERKSILINYYENPAFYGRLDCNSRPEGCDIYLNDSLTGETTPHEFDRLVPGLYKVTYKKEKHEDKSFNIGVWSSVENDTIATLVDTTIWKYYNMDNSGIPVNNITCVEADNTGEVWFGTSSKGIVHFDGSVFRTYSTANSELANNHITDIAFDRDNNFWITTFDGATFTNFGGWQSFSSKFFPLPPGVITSVDVRIYDGFYDGEAWMVAPSGVYFTFDDPEFGRGWNMITAETGFPEVTPREIKIDGAGRRWVSTDNGVVHVISSNEIYHYTVGNSGIPSNDITAITASGSQVWVACATFSGNRGGTLAYLENNDWTPFVISIDDEMKAVRDLLIDNKGRLWAATNLGIYLVNGFNDIKVLNEESTGVDLSNIIELTQDTNGNIWMATSDNGLIKYMGE